MTTSNTVIPLSTATNEHDVSARTEDLKYLLISNVNVSNFVSVKLSDHSNYPIWKAQMRCLIESQELLHLIEAEIQMKGDGDNVMIKKYDNLVKGWIFGSMNENVLKNIIQIETAKEVWIQLESFFGTPKTGIEGDSWNAQTEDLKYTQASNVNVSNFVSVKLLGRINYKIWKAQMHCLIESQVLLHIIDARHPFPVDKGFHMISQYDKLVKGWIFGTMSDHMLNNFADFNSAREVWTELESRFSLPIRSSRALYVSAPTEDLRYMLASTVNVSSRNNYHTWKEQMLCLIESHELLHIIHPKADFVWKGGPDIIEYDKLVKGWMLVTLNDELLIFERYKRFPLARYLWEELESDFTNGIVGDSSDELDVITHTNGLKYMQASNVNVSSFVSVKLSGHNNYHIWKEQMLCMIKSQGLLHLTRDEKLNRFNFLVRGWILSTMTDEVLKQFCDYETAGFIWIELESRFKDPPDDDKEISVGFVFGIESITDVPELENTDSIRLKKELYEAAVEGCWWKAKSILKTHKNAATEAITLNGNTILHVSVEMGNNYFVEKLLGFLEDPEDIEKKNLNGWTALHMAAAVGNIDAAQLLVQKRKELLVIRDSEERAPLDIANAKFICIFVEIHPTLFR